MLGLFPQTTQASFFCLFNSLNSNDSLYTPENKAAKEFIRNTQNK